MTNRTSNAYKESGVDLQAGYESVERIKSHVKRTKIKGAIDSLGAFGGMFDLSSLHLKEPVLVSGTDGVGTKLLLAIETDKHDTIGIDAVAMCVNDVLVQGALPIFFLDYLAVDKNVPSKIEQIVKGVADGCVESECALIGGETAEMPDMYEKDHYDIAGFCVGAVEKRNMITNEKVCVDDVLIGIASSGVHSNGFSLIRKIMFKDHNLSLDEIYAPCTKPLKEELLTPTKLYVKAIKALLPEVDIHGMSHITGGGFYENLPRMLPDGLGVDIALSSFPKKPVFTLLQELSHMEQDEMYNVFNMGIGFVLALNPKDVDKALMILKEHKEEAYVIGKITNTNKVVLHD